MSLSLNLYIVRCTFLSYLDQVGTLKIIGKFYFKHVVIFSNVNSSIRIHLKNLELRYKYVQKLIGEKEVYKNSHAIIYKRGCKLYAILNISDSPYNLPKNSLRRETPATSLNEIVSLFSFTFAVCSNCKRKRRMCSVCIFLRSFSSRNRRNRKRYTTNAPSCFIHLFVSLRNTCVYIQLISKSSKDYKPDKIFQVKIWTFDWFLIFQANEENYKFY